MRLVRVENERTHELGHSELELGQLETTLET